MLAFINRVHLNYPMAQLALRHETRSTLLLTSSDPPDSGGIRCAWVGDLDGRWIGVQSRAIEW